MRLSFATDLHGQRILIEKFFHNSVKEKADLIILGGDILPRAFGALEARIRIQREFLEGTLLPIIARHRQDNPDKTLICMFGNDDYRVNYPLFQEASRQGLFHLPGKLIRVWDLSVLAYNFINTSPFMLKDWEKEDFESKRLEGVMTTQRADFNSIYSDLEAFKGKARKLMLVTHAPPSDTKLDVIHNKAHVGSKAIRRFIEEEQPVLALSGHIHESSEISGSYQDRIGSTICMNPGSDPFKQRSNMLLVDIDGGEVKASSRIPL
jgi:uncharacterized protein